MDFNRPRCRSGTVLAKYCIPFRNGFNSSGTYWKPPEHSITSCCVLECPSVRQACNHKKIYRVYTMLKLNIRRRTKRRIPQRIKQPLVVPQGLNKAWSMDFMTDSLVDGRRFRLLNIMDDYNRESLAVEADTSLPAARVIRVLKRLVEFRGAPESIRVDNGPEFISDRLQGWCEYHGTRLQFIQPGKPVQNAFIERKNGSMRKEPLDAYLFYSLEDVRVLAEQWRYDYNHERPHESLGNVPPVEYQNPVSLGN